LLNERQERGDLLIYVSDYESWLDAGRSSRTETEAQWNAFSKRNPDAKLACIDITPVAALGGQHDLALIRARWPHLPIPAEPL
jgi:hypothetical protein